MNENIEKLAFSASTYADNQCAKVKKLEDGESWISIRDKKFAELIILECCKISDEIEPLELPHKTSKFIKQHFGVKE